MVSTDNQQSGIFKPVWLKTKLPSGKAYVVVKDIVRTNKLHTICESGNCPNIGECWGSGTATFMILGNICTRSCEFCAVESGKPLPVDKTEPVKIANSVLLMRLKHCVITSVDRDDLPDGGASVWAETIRSIRRISPGTTIETLIPDFKGVEEHLDQIINETPEIVSHNLETVRTLTKKVRKYATYERSLHVLSYLRAKGMTVKSGIMTGLGETNEEILETMQDIAHTGCEIFTIGQYLRPSLKHLPVNRFVTPGEFLMFKEEGIRMGFRTVESGPLVRSSYHAENHLFENI